MRDKEDSEEDLAEDAGYDSDGGGAATVAENLVAPVKPLALLLPHRDHSTGILHWRLFFLTVSLLTTTSGVSLCCLRELRSSLKFEPFPCRPSLSRPLRSSSSATSLTLIPKTSVKFRLDPVRSLIRSERMGTCLSDLLKIRLFDTPIPDHP